MRLQSSAVPQPIDSAAAAADEDVVPAGCVAEFRFFEQCRGHGVHGRLRGERQPSRPAIRPLAECFQRRR